MKTIRGLICALLALALLTTSALAFDGLKKGDKGSEVQMLQLRLNALGYSVGTADADYGNKTVKAVESFQNDHGLEATGAVDQATWDALYDEHVTVVREGYSADVALTAPFTVIKDDPDNPQTAWMWLDDLSCAADLIFFDSMDNLVGGVLTYLENSRYADVADSLKAENYDAHSEALEINGHSAALIEESFDFSNNGSKLTDHFLWGAIELADAGGQKVILRFNTAFTLGAKQESLLTLDSIREMLERATFPDSPASAQSEADPILGDWYIQDGTDSITLHIFADGTYSADFDGLDPAQGTWKADGDGYVMDNGPLKMTVDGDTLTLGEDGSDSPDIFGRERIEAPTLAAVTDATEADYLGEWKVSGVFLCDQKGMPIDDDNLLEENATVTVAPGSLTLSGLFNDDETYDTHIAEGGLTLSNSNGEGMFINGVMQLLEDGSAEIYIPGLDFMCLTLERA